MSENKTDKILSGFVDVIQGGLFGSTLTFAVGTILWAIIFAFFPTMRLFGITLFWGLMAFICGMFYILVKMSRVEENEDE